MRDFSLSSDQYSQSSTNAFVILDSRSVTSDVGHIHSIFISQVTTMGWPQLWGGHSYGVAIAMGATTRQAKISSNIRKRMNNNRQVSITMFPLCGWCGCGIVHSLSYGFLMYIRILKKIRNSMPEVIAVHCCSA